VTVNHTREQRLVEEGLLRSELQRTLDARVTIEQAKGFLAHTHRVDVDTAFQLLRSQARLGGMRIVDAARAVLNNAAVPGPGEPDFSPPRPADVRSSG
jgi:AmiR/NasT family two-component response regulator